MEDLASQLRTAFNARDIDTFRGLLAEDARWGNDPFGPRTCHNRAEIIAHLKRFLDEGVRASIVATTTGPRGIACVVAVEWPDSHKAASQPQSLFQVYVVTEGLVTEILGYDDEESALAAIET